ncbi:hypothetical protein [Streptomyces sp. ICC4]|nr:hypothetical protein [Streptomyces sp. ICC4]
MDTEVCIRDRLAEVQSTRIRSMLAATARTLVPHQRSPRVGAFLTRHASA